MPSFLQKLSKIVSRLKGGAEAAAGTPFSTQCDCGEKVTGVRRSSWIEAECQNCYQTVFILPANIYPSTRRVPSPVLGGSFLERLRAVIAELRPEPEKKPALNEQAKPSGSRQPAEPGRVAKLAGQTRELISGIDLRRIAKRTFTPFRLLMVAIIVVVGLTGSWMMHQRAVEDAQTVWLESAETISEQLASGSFIELEESLFAAVAAADVLEKDDSESNVVRNLLAEVHAVNNIAPSDLLTAFDHAYDNSSRLLNDAAGLVDATMTSGAFLFDSYLYPAADDRTYVIDLPAAAGKHNIQVLVPASALRGILNSVSEPRLLFACEFDVIEPPTAASEFCWVLNVRPESFVLMTNADLCAEVGMSAEYDPEIEEILVQQKDFVEGNAAVSAAATDVADVTDHHEEPGT